MLLVCVLASLSVLLGAWMGLARTPSVAALRAIQFAGVGAGTVAVFVLLLPEASGHVGWTALIAFALSFALSTTIERLLLVPRTTRRERDWARSPVDIGVVALALHQALEGVALGSVHLVEDAHGHHGASQTGTLLSLVAHTVPVTAVFIIVVARTLGRAAAVRRVLVLLLASMSGVVLVLVPGVEHALLSAGGWLHAVVAGLLLHALLHAALPIRSQDAATARRELGWAWAFRLLGAALVLATLLARPDVHELFTAQAALVVLGALAVTAVFKLAWPHPAHDDWTAATKAG